MKRPFLVALAALLCVAALCLFSASESQCDPRSALPWLNCPVTK